MLRQLAGCEPIDCRLLIVMAHPDDETIALGGQLWRMRDAILLHITDGAPRDGEDARRLGFDNIADYAAIRRQELAQALTLGEAAHVRNIELGLSDKEAVRDLARLTSRIFGFLGHEGPAAVLTHPYEGGHPDHDAASFAVHTARRLFSSNGRPVIIEMPFYHIRNGEMATGVFRPSQTKEIVVPLDETALARKRRMADCFRTQREMLSRFPLNPERFRAAPDYDFRQPPHAGALLYETFGWDITGSEWRQRATAALEALGL